MLVPVLESMEFWFIEKECFADRWNGIRRYDLWADHGIFQYPFLGTANAFITGVHPDLGCFCIQAKTEITNLKLQLFYAIDARDHVVNTP